MDSKIYYSYFKLIASAGPIEAITTFSESAGKLEPIFIFAFWAQQLFIGSDASQTAFIIINYSLISGAIAHIAAKVLWPIETKRSISQIILVCIICLATHFYLQKLIFIWRTMIGLAFFLAFAGESKRRRYIYLILAVASHHTFVIFAAIFEAIKWIMKRHPKEAAVAFFVAIAAAPLLSWTLWEYLTIFMAGGGGFLRADFFKIEEHTYRALASLGTAILILLLLKPEMDRKFRSSDRAELPPAGALYYFSLFTTCMAASLVNNYTLLTRVSAPAMVLIGFIAFSIKAETKSAKLAQALTMLSIIPAGRLLLKIAQGKFLS